MSQQDQKNTSIPGFLTKTYEIFTSPEYRYCCDWGKDGNSIVVTKIEDFSKQVLPKYFKHSNFQSFVRQLNMYDFHKLVQDPNNGEFTHENFLRDHPDRLCLIKRKANNRPQDSTKKGIIPHISNELLITNFGMKNEDFALEADNVMNELVEQRKIRDEFEKRLLETEDKLKDLSKVEARQSYLESENLFLKQMVVESRNKQLYMQEKMERVLKLLYSAYISSGGTLGGHSQTLIDNGLQGMLSIEDGSQVNMKSILGDGYIADTPLDYSLSRMNSDNLSLSRMNSLRSYDLDDLFPSSSEPADDTSFGSSSQSVKCLQSRNVASSSLAYQGKDLCRIHSIDNDAPINKLSKSASYQALLESQPSKRLKIGDDNTSALQQQELDLLHRNQDMTLTRIDSLESTISNLLDFIDEFDPSEIPPGNGITPTVSFLAQDAKECLSITNLD